MTAHQARLAAVLALTAAALSGCDFGGDSTEPPKAVATPRDTLLKAVPDAKTAAYRFAVEGGQTPMSGVLDAPAKAFAATFVESEPDAGFTLTMRMLVIDKDSWMRMTFKPATIQGLPKVPKKWLKLDQSKLKDGKDNPLSFGGDETDPGYTELVVQSASGVTQTDAGHFTGTTDLTRSTEAEIVEDTTLKALGSRAKTVPFTAEVDGSGRLTSLIIKIPAAGKTRPSTYSVSYSGFGSTTSPAVPAAGEQAPATAAVYDLLNS